MKSTTTSVTKTIELYSFNGAEILDALVKSKKLNKSILKDSNLITVSFEVPGGGDWSHSQIEIDEDHPIRIKVEKTEVK